jgi:signal transduction histidine kinase
VKEEQRHLRRLLEMHEQNRKLVAYEIHDGLVQSLVAARMLLEGAKHTIDNHGSDADKESCQGGFQLLGNAVDQARVLMGGQRPLILDERGLLAAIEYLVHEGEKFGSAEILFTHDVKFERLAPPLETAVFRIVQECLTNARRHSQSEKVRVELAQTNGNIKLKVEDWGTGFSPDSVTSSCFGLEGVRERARLFGGKAKIDSTPGKGTRISVKLPVVEA